ncbi:MAG TPA: hypothetical protein VFV72_00675 [Candidatus Limnocylindrales bacterium]|nr:hypothetical protein [Candidatus Limnocylindrales bacterium]
MHVRIQDIASRRNGIPGGRRLRLLVIGGGVALLVATGPLPSALAIVTSGDKPVFVDVTPRRIADTRFDIGIANAVASGVPRVLQVTGNVPIAPSGSATVVPNGATAVVLNVTAVGPTRSGYVSVRPGNPGGTPTTSNLNVDAGVTIPNQVTVGLPPSGGNAGRIQIWFQGSGGGSTHILVDVVGYYENHRHDDRYYVQAETREIVLEHETLTGVVDFDGAKGAPGPYTPSRSSTGKYFVNYDTSGLGIPPDEMPPNIVATPSFLCPDGTMAMAGWASYTTTDEVNFFTLAIETYSHTGAAVDCEVFYQVSFGGHTTVAVDEPGTAGSSAQGPAQAIECRKTESGAVCSPAK